MRTTVTLENDVVKRLRDTAHRESRSFKSVINDTLRIGLLIRRPAPKRKKFALPTYSMGVRPGIDLTKANALAAELEDQEIIRKMSLGK